MHARFASAPLVAPARSSSAAATTSRRLALAVLASSASLASCTSVSHTIAQRREIESVVRAYETHYNARDAHALALVHTRDGRYATPGDPMPSGRAALESFWSRAAGGGLALELADFETCGDVGWALGTWSRRTPDGATEPGGRFVLALRREDGTWRIAVDINNEIRR
jgi:uncharacterized protein (TIGR02246 family)